MRNGLRRFARSRSNVIEMIVTRADGTVENLGVVSYWHRNPFKTARVAG
jgi:hypothetical protein